MTVNTPDHDGFQEYELKDTVLSYPDPDGKANVHAPKDIAPQSEALKKSNPYITTEQALNPKKKDTSYLDYIDPTNKEDKGVEEVYDGSAFYGISGHSL
jgi:hypothetical protein